MAVRNQLRLTEPSSFHYCGKQEELLLRCNDDLAEVLAAGLQTVGC